MDHFFFFLPAFLTDLPLFIVEIIGVIVALVYWKRHPHASLFVMLGLLIMLLARALRILANVVLPVMLIESQRMQGSALSNIIAPASFVLVVFEALGLIFVVVAAFQRRAQV